MGRMSWKRLAAVAASACVVAGVAGAAASARTSPQAAGKAEAAAPVKVGIIYSRTGLLSAFGAQYIQIGRAHV